MSGRSVRIAAGRWKGRPLEVPPGTRPTSGRAREALFSILRDSVVGARVLDLYAGSGAFGLEALSRGAASAVLVERHPAAIDRTVQRLQASPEEVSVLRGEAQEAIRRLVDRAERFDLVFSDPPYLSPASARVTPEIARLIAPGGLLILQIDRMGGAGAFEEPQGWSILKRREYGRNVFLFLSPASISLRLSLPDE